MHDGVRMASGPGSADWTPSRPEPPSTSPPVRSLRPVEAEAAPLDCAECGSAGSVYHGFCEVCYADADPAAGPPLLHPSVPLRFADVVEELRAIADLASGMRGVPGGRVAAACRRAESLLTVLRRQFLQDVVFGGEAPGTGTRP